tara:strand:- start:58 stop:825 length:768 start_codon:yes stop_codon:yes gene_type:complete
MPKTKDPNLHHVSVQAEPVVLHKDIKEKISEICVKRDALMLAHNKVNLEQDKYNKAIICLSLFAAFFESTKAQLNLSTRNDWLAPISILMPILLSTVLSIISSLMKFKKFNERIDLLSKATEKSNATVLNLRRLEESLNFQSYMQSYKDYSGSVNESYRDALDCYERALYPQEHNKYLTQAIKIAKDTKKYEKKNEMDNFLHSKFYPNNIQLDSPEVETVSQEVTQGKEEESDNVIIDIKDNIEKCSCINLVIII